MTTAFRNQLLASTIIAGFALCASGPVSAGPNSPSFSGPSVSSMRSDFSMRAPNALREGDIGNPRSGLDTSRIKKNTKKDTKKDTKKKGTDTAARGKTGAGAAAAGAGAIGGATGASFAPNQTASGGQDKPAIGGSSIQIPAGLEEIIKIFGGNPDAINNLKDLFDLVRLGEMAFLARNPVFGGGDEAGPLGDLPKVSQGDHGSISLDPPGSPTEGTGIGARIGWFATGGSGGTQWGTPKRWRDDNGTEVTEYHGNNENSGRTIWTREERNSDGSSYGITISRRDGDSAVWSETRSRPYMSGGVSYQDYERRRYGSGRDSDGTPTDRYRERGTEETRGATAKAANEDPYFYAPEAPKPKEEDGMPNEDGYGSGGGGRYYWHGGSRGSGGPYIIPREEGSTSVSSGPRASPSWATDPCPDCSGQSGGGGRSNPRPPGSDVGWAPDGTPMGPGTSSGGTGGVPGGGAPQ